MDGRAAAARQRQKAVIQAGSDCSGLSGHHHANHAAGWPGSRGSLSLLRPLEDYGAGMSHYHVMMMPASPAGTDDATAKARHDHYCSNNAASHKQVIIPYQQQRTHAESAKSSATLPCSAYSEKAGEDIQASPLNQQQGQELLIQQELHAEAACFLAMQQQASLSAAGTSSTSVGTVGASVGPLLPRLSEFIQQGLFSYLQVADYAAVSSSTGLTGQGGRFSPSIRQGHQVQNGAGSIADETSISLEVSADEEILTNVLKTMSGQQSHYLFQHDNQRAAAATAIAISAAAYAAATTASDAASDDAAARPASAAAATTDALPLLVRSGISGISGIRHSATAAAAPLSSAAPVAPVSGTEELASMPHLLRNFLVTGPQPPPQPLLQQQQQDAGALRQGLTNLSLLGKGGYGMVYKARWHGSLVAVKFVVSESAEQLEESVKDAAICKSLSHPHIIHTYGHGGMSAYEDFLSLYQDRLCKEACTASSNSSSSIRRAAAGDDRGDSYGDYPQILCSTTAATSTAAASSTAATTATSSTTVTTAASSTTATTAASSTTVTTAASSTATAVVAVAVVAGMAVQHCTNCTPSATTHHTHHTNSPYTDNKNRLIGSRQHMGLVLRGLISSTSRDYSHRDDDDNTDEPRRRPLSTTWEGGGNSSLDNGSDSDDEEKLVISRECLMGDPATGSDPSAVYPDVNPAAASSSDVAADCHYSKQMPSTPSDEAKAAVEVTRHLIPCRDDPGGYPLLSMMPRAPIAAGTAGHNNKDALCVAAAGMADDCTAGRASSYYHSPIMKLVVGSFPPVVAAAAGQRQETFLIAKNLAATSSRREATSGGKILLVSSPPEVQAGISRRKLSSTLGAAAVAATAGRGDNGSYGSGGGSSQQLQQNKQHEVHEVVPISSNTGRKFRRTLSAAAVLDCNNNVVPSRLMIHQRQQAADQTSTLTTTTTTTARKAAAAADDDDDHILVVESLLLETISRGSTVSAAGYSGTAIYC
ncbi:hypothetical protein CEUSTIGMA_g9334.t1 [Chlamydomonas eustigma]|uniref:Serine-threonine/tyrosine-protein kinase catalytic domain-containing protein n=1 Tax=Chlamydomonas eustigma TaxID=1157962 RepID=A0A250XFV0_9CHLO|nr:hypothetical protein CEUSTIGMA_g9334.t1 [Chlamydomonas eustigma]|eukprot:GAX81906.1 hypothetical protein CEUSTIGMA_g9334.t1 [Chlamydomonas eustigma]